MKTLLAAAVAVSLLGCDAEEQAEDRCRSACPAYGATFAGITCGGDACSMAVRQWECWCRRGAESGGGSEPLRIW